jgi:two-component system LytT family sensor kinase
VLIGLAAVASVAGAVRLAPRSLFFGQGRAMQAALHAATMMLPDLRRGLTPEAAERAAPHLRMLTQASAIALTDRVRVLAFDGRGADHHRTGDPVTGLGLGRDHDHVHIASTLRCEVKDCPLHAAIVAPLTVGGERVGGLIAFYPSAERLTGDDAVVIAEAASLVAAQVELSTVDAQGERLARAELQALRAQISPHFIYNALAAVAGYIHTRPDEARELLTEFAEFIRYAFRGQRPHVSLADELEYVQKYLRLQQARFGSRLTVHWDIDAQVIETMVPVLSLQPLVENAVRHGLERRGGRGTIEVRACAAGPEIELRVSDDGVGMDSARARAALDGTVPARAGIGLSNVQSRLQATFGPSYGLHIDSAPGRGTTVTIRLPRSPSEAKAA